MTSQSAPESTAQVESINEHEIQALWSFRTMVEGTPAYGIAQPARVRYPTVPVVPCTGTVHPDSMPSTDLQALVAADIRVILQATSEPPDDRFLAIDSVIFAADDDTPLTGTKPASALTNQALAQLSVAAVLELERRLIGGN